MGYYLVDEGRTQLEAGGSRTSALLAGSCDARRAAPLLAYTSADRAAERADRAACCWRAWRSRTSAAAGWSGWSRCSAAGRVSQLGDRAGELDRDGVRAASLLPRLDFSDGIPGCAHRWWWSPRCSAAWRDVDVLVEALEVRFLANRDPNLHFGLLTDFLDAPTRDPPPDDALRSGRRGSRH